MNKKCSFTLLELLLTLSIVLVLVSIGIPHLINKNQFELKHELEHLEIIFYYLQQRAMATNVEQELFFNPTDQTYSFKKNTKTITHKLAQGLHFGFKPNVLGPPGDPKELIAQAITLPLHPTQKNIYCAKFLPNGKMYPGAVYITDKQKNGLGALTCDVSRVSCIRKYLYTSNQWTAFTA